MGRLSFPVFSQICTAGHGEAQGRKKRVLRRENSGMIKSEYFKFYLSSGRFDGKSMIKAEFICPCGFRFEDSLHESEVSRTEDFERFYVRCPPVRGRGLPSLVGKRSGKMFRRVKPRFLILPSRKSRPASGPKRWPRSRSELTSIASGILKGFRIFHPEPLESLWKGP